MDQDQRHGGRRDFHLEINSFEDFKELVALIRGGGTEDETQIAELAEQLKDERIAIENEVTKHTPST